MIPVAAQPFSRWWRVSYTFGTYKAVSPSSPHVSATTSDGCTLAVAWQTENWYISTVKVDVDASGTAFMSIKTWKINYGCTSTPKSINVLDGLLFDADPDWTIATTTGKHTLLRISFVRVFQHQCDKIKLGLLPLMRCHLPTWVTYHSSHHNQTHL